MEALLISADELRNLTCAKMYIMVYAKVCAAFALEVHALNETYHDTYLPIIPGVSERGYLQAEETITYLLALEKLKVYNMQVKLFAQHGNPDVYIKQCSGFVGDFFKGVQSLNDDCIVTDDMKKNLILGHQPDKTLVAYGNLLNGG
jgi:hypothetical protein